RTVLGLFVFPFAGTHALFSNVVNHSFVVRRASVAGLGNAARFKTDEKEYRFSCRFDVLDPASGAAPRAQRGTCTLPDGQTLALVVNDVKGASTPDGVYRVFAGLRSDPFYLAWVFATLKKAPNLLQHDNALCIVIELDARRAFDAGRGSLFAVIAETSPIHKPGALIGHDPPRFDWVGRPEQTNMRLNNSALAGTDDLRDLWNQQTPFAISAKLKPLFHQRMMDSLGKWDSRDGKTDWKRAEMEASANVFNDDFLLFDVSKPTTDESFLEIEKSTLKGVPYRTGGGRTVDADVIDIMVTWMVNHDREFLQGGATQATQRGIKTFPYFAPPNAQVQTVAESVDLLAPPDQVWALVGAFGGMWHPLIARIELTGSGVGQLRSIETIDGKRIVERLEAFDDAQRLYRYSNVSGMPAEGYTGTLEVKPKDAGSSVAWNVQYLANGQPTIAVKTVVSQLLGAGLASLKARFGTPK
ncbi:SRPBCC family protein, partial [Variovorax sp. J22R133]|uniref:SRPBCC family protein n=1 Tax=Variovorax brevis TaxID=3053503 RepID=UPI002574BA45